MAQIGKRAAPRTNAQSPNYPTLAAMTIAATLCACGGQESGKAEEAASGGATGTGMQTTTGRAYSNGTGGGVAYV